MQCIRDGQTPIQDASVYMKKNTDLNMNIPSRHQRCGGVSPFQLHRLDTLHEQKSQYRSWYMLIRGVNVIKTTNFLETHIGQWHVSGFDTLHTCADCAALK